MGKFADQLAPKFADSTEPKLSDFKQGSVAWVLQRYIEEMDGTAGGVPVKPLGESHRCTLRVIQRMPIGAKLAEKLTKTDIIDMAKALRTKGLKPATVNQYITYLRGPLAYAPAAWEGCEEVSAECVAKARPFLKKYNLCGKASPRKRRPTDEEVGRLLAYFEVQDKRDRTKIKMVDVVAFALASSRRRGEIVRITHGDVDFEKKIYWVRDLKHPTKKKGNDKSFILWPELEVIIKRQPRRNPNDPQERVFPFDGKSVGKRYIDAKKALGIKDLRFHDNRRDCISRYLLIMPPEDVRLAVSGHDNTKILETSYDGRDTLEIMREKYPHLVPQTVGAQVPR